MKKTFNASIVSVKQQHTAVVEIFRKTSHPLYKKLLTRSQKLNVDTGEFTPKEGDMVRVEETRPLSKTKHFKIVEVIKK